MMWETHPKSTLQWAQDVLSTSRHSHAIIREAWDVLKEHIAELERQLGHWKKMNFQRADVAHVLRTRIDRALEVNEPTWQRDVDKMRAILQGDADG